MVLDHLILRVNDADESAQFYAAILGLPNEGKTGLEFGDSFGSVGSMNGPGQEAGARGLGASPYFFDPNRHLIEIRHYD